MHIITTEILKELNESMVDYLEQNLKLMQTLADI